MILQHDQQVSESGLGRRCGTSHGGRPFDEALPELTTSAIWAHLGPRPHTSRQHQGIPNGWYGETHAELRVFERIRETYQTRGKLVAHVC